jgi:diguanylate cyclase (GGDEF)-like protein
MKTNNNFHILIVDDEKLNIELAALYLQEEGYKISFAINAEGVIESVMTNDISLILLDINMPGKDGFDICAMLKEDVKTKDIPIIFLTAQTDIEYVSKAFEVGGVDYISKPFNGVELKARVRTHLQNVAYLDEIKHKQSKLAQISITDPLTKLNNSLFFDSQIKNYQKRDEKFWIIYLKIDRFEKINQVYGFFEANKIIRTFAKIIEKSSFSNTVVARLYGASFGILVKDYDKKLIKNIYEEIRLTLLKNKDISKVVSFYTVFYNVKDSSTSIPFLYKQLQSNIQTMEKTEDRYLFIK